LVFTLPFFQSSKMETHKLTTKIMAKMPKITCHWSSWASEILFTTCVRAAEVLAAKLASPRYSAVMEWLPPDNELAL
jgi:hypothetical protein